MTAPDGMTIAATRHPTTAHCAKTRILQASTAVRAYLSLDVSRFHSVGHHGRPRVQFLGNSLVIASDCTQTGLVCTVSHRWSDVQRHHASRITTWLIAPERCNSFTGVPEWTRSLGLQPS